MSDIQDKLHAAKRAKKDEFYTQFSTIEKELFHYRHHFKNKTVFLNCDDAESSNFWKYFELNFDFFELNRLISVHFVEDGTSYSTEMIKIDDVIKKYRTNLKGNGDFRNEESVNFLKESDIVVTNPPFSLFREYIAQIFEYGKSFIIMGNNNAITYKEIFPLIKENKMWLGNNSNFNCEFEVGEGYRYSREENGKRFGSVRSISWFTNLEIKKRHEEIILTHCRTVRPLCRHTADTLC